jgi:hypothetical protein
MKMTLLIQCVACLLVLTFSDVLRGEENVKLQDVTVSATITQKVPLGQDVVIDLALTSKSKQSLYSMDTADLVVVVETMGKSNKKYICDRGRIRQNIEIMADGSSIVDTINVPKQRVTIGQGDSSRTVMTVLKDFDTRLSCGEYSVSVVYEGKVKTNTTFSVVVDSERTVPMLIDLLAGSDEWTRNWSRDELFSIVGRPTWKPLRDDTKERIDSEVGAMRKWWDENKGKSVFRVLKQVKAQVKGTEKQRGATGSDLVSGKCDIEE